MRIDRKRRVNMYDKDYELLKRSLEDDLERLRSGQVSKDESHEFLVSLGLLNPDGSYSENYYPKTASSRKVFLGGTCGDSNWRDELIDLIEIDYFNPVVEDWDEKAKQEELKQRKECSDILYVITPDMEGVYSIAEAVDDSNKRPDRTIFCYLEKSNDKEFTKAQKSSLDSVSAMIEGNGAKVFDNLKDIAGYLNELV
jgi:hypothetical protein